MKHILLRVLFILLVFIAPGAQAQRFNYGIIAGLNYSQIAGASYGRSFQKLGVPAGGLVSLNLGERWQFRAQLKFNQKGQFKTADFDLGDIEQWKIKLNYIDTDFIIRFNVWRGLSIYSGLEHGWLVYKKLEDEGVTMPVEYKSVTYTKTDLSLSYGLSLKILDNLHLNIGPSYSLKPISTEEIHYWYSTYFLALRSYTYVNSFFYNETITITLDYQFRRKKDKEFSPSRNVRHL